MESESPKIEVGDLYKKVQGIGSSSNTYAVVTGSFAVDGRVAVTYNVYSDSKLYATAVAENVKSMQDEFLSYYAKV